MALPVAFISNYAMNPSAWGWGTYSGLFWVYCFYWVDLNSADSCSVALA